MKNKFDIVSFTKATGIAIVYFSILAMMILGGIRIVSSVNTIYHLWDEFTILITTGAILLFILLLMFVYANRRINNLYEEIEKLKRR